MLSDEGYIIENLFMIADKEGKDVPFVLNDVQRDLDDGLTGRDLVPKARQEGVSSYCLARYTAACLFKRNTRAVVISHDQESTQRMLKRVKYYLEHIRGPKAKIQNMSANEVTFPKTNSMFYIGTAGARKFGRGDTISHLHCSEYAFWPNPLNLMTGLLQAVPMGTGEICVDSTGNGLNDYYNRCMRAYSRQSRWTIHFYPWHTFEEYTLELGPEEEEDGLSNLDIAMEEDKLPDRGFTPGQIAWRRAKLEELDYDLSRFKQEYPETLDECFQMSGESVFHRVHYDPTDGWKEVERGLWILDGHPTVSKTYALGGDVAAGVGKDNSVVEVVCLETGEQVAEYVNNSIDPEQFGYKVTEIGERFGHPYACVESNNHGILTLAVMNKVYPAHKIHSEPIRAKTEDLQLSHLGRRTTARTRPLLIGRLRAELADALVIHSPLLKGELSTFIEHENGKMEAQSGCRDDTVIAMAQAVSGLNEAAMFKESQIVQYQDRLEDNPFTLDAIIKELRGRGTHWPVKPQHSLDGDLPFKI